MDTCSIQEVGDDFEGVALVNEKLLALCGVVHLLCVPGYQRVEEGVELICSLRSRLALHICIILIDNISHTRAKSVIDAEPSRHHAHFEVEHSGAPPHRQ